MDDEVVAHVRRGYRQMQIVRYGLLLLFFGFVTALFFRWNRLLPALVIVLFVYLLLFMPLVRVENDLRLVTDRSPSQVRDTFRSADNPVAIAVCALADEDDVDVNENEAIYETTLPFGLRTVRTRYKAEQRQHGGLLVRSWMNGSELTVATVSVEPADGTGSLVTIESERSGRINLRTLLLLWVLNPQIIAAFEANGYEIINDETRYGLR